MSVQSIGCLLIMWVDVAVGGNFNFNGIGVYSACVLSIYTMNKELYTGVNSIKFHRRFLRKTSLDEFSQFFNMLFGQMSVEGPRLHMLKHTDMYSELIEHYKVRHYMKLGITGWAQVNGYRGVTYVVESGKTSRI